MRHIIIGHSDSTSVGTYKVVIDKEDNTLFNTMQSNLDQHRAYKRNKRFRIAFTTEQTNYLEEEFKKSQYINREQRQRVASILNIGERPIKIWFQNRRMKEKKENHREFDDESYGNTQTLGNDHNMIHNMSASPSTNDYYLNSLPVLSFTRDTTVYINNDNNKQNIDEGSIKTTTKPENPMSATSTEEEIPRANFYKELNNQEPENLSLHFSKQPIIDPSLLILNSEKYKLPSQDYKNTTSAEFSINLCKKYKQQSASTDTAVARNSNEVQNMKEEKEAMKPETFIIPNDLPPNIKCKLSSSLPSNLQTHLRNPMYYPLLPSMYTSPMTSLSTPYLAPDGVLWKPVNFMPVMASNSVDNATRLMPSQPEHIKNCTCNCHENSPQVPANIPTSQNPYAQYVITVPIPHTSSKF